MFNTLCVVYAKATSEVVIHTALLSYPLLTDYSHRPLLLTMLD